MGHDGRDYLIFGNLYLPHPASFRTHAELQDLKQLMPHLRHIEAAPLEDYISNHGYSDEDIRRAFETFKAKETQLWIPVRKSEDELVPSSGSIKAKIALHLNHPTFGRHITDYLAAIPQPTT